MQHEYKIAFQANALSFLLSSSSGDPDNKPSDLTDLLFASMTWA